MLLCVGAPFCVHARTPLAAAAGIYRAAEWLWSGLMFILNIITIVIIIVIVKVIIIVVMHMYIYIYIYIWRERERERESAREI